MEKAETAIHLQIIQGVISRMGTNSFVLKGWNVTLVSALFALAAKNSNPLFIIIAILPSLTFWCLDAYYLRQERLFRKLYDEICETIDNEQAHTPFTMCTKKFKNIVPAIFQTLFAPTVFMLHGVVIAVVIIVIIILLCAD